MELCAGVLYNKWPKIEKKSAILEKAKSEDSENTTHVDFGRFLAILEHSA